MSDVLEHTLTPKFTYEPYPYQQFPFTCYAKGLKRIVLVWPRRAGKDLTALNFTLVRALERVGTYFYFLPTHKQAKRIIWDGMDDEGMKFLSYIPVELIKDKNEAELQITLINDSIIQLIGADSIDTSAVGTNCVGAIFSEYSIQKESGWDYVRPILRKNGGWALFLYTPRGHNHGYTLYNTAIKPENHHEWGVSKLVAHDIVDWQGKALIPQSFIDAEIRSGMAPEKADQEFNTSFSGIQQGSYFADQCVLAEAEERYGIHPHDPDLKVYTVSDLGKGLNFATWFFQVKDNAVKFIEYHVLESGAIPEFIQYIRSKKYTYARHFAPHDVRVTELGTGQTRVESARRLGLRFTALPVLPVADRVDAGRRLFPISYFNKPGISSYSQYKDGWSTLLNYRRLFDEDKHEYGDAEVHDWASHGGSAFTYAAVAIRKVMNLSFKGTQAVTDFDEHEDTITRYADTEFDEYEGGDDD